MKRCVVALILLVYCLIFTAAQAASDPNDKPGSADPDLFSRMPGFHINQYETLAFDRQEFQVGPGSTEKVEGRKISVIYYANEGIALPSRSEERRVGKECRL